MIFENMPESEYFDIEAASNSFNKKIIEFSGSPLRALLSTMDKTETPAMVFGSAFHAAILEPNNFEDRYCSVPEDAPRKPTSAQRNAKKPSDETIHAIKWWDEFDAETGGKRILKPDDFETLLEMRDKTHEHPDVKDVFSCHYSTELSIVRDHEPRVAKKARIDMLANGILPIDFKTADDVSDDAIRRAIFDRGYFMQDAWYTDLLIDEGIQPAGFIFFFCLKKPPFSVRAVELSEVDRELGRKRNKRAFEVYRKCAIEDHWPDYTTGIRSIGLPAWAYSQLEHEEA